MRNIQTFQVLPFIPEPLAFLETLTRNIWWCWQRDAVELFRRINPGIWNDCGGNPIHFLTRIPVKRLEALARDHGFLAHMERVREDFQNQINQPPAYETPFTAEATIAYFSMEFGLHESIPLYSGGLGVLAGDHLKAASDHKLPLVGVGLFYRQGYFRQFLNDDGWQQETYPENDVFMLPAERARGASGDEIMIAVDGPEGRIHAVVWEIRVGCIPLYLLDTNVRENPPEFRVITGRLYSGGSRRRLAQELVLGIGGMRTLEALNRTPWVVHMNEGHSAFASLERLHHMVTSHGIDLKTALEIIPRTTVFTTHTPVAAGHDDFPVDMLGPCLTPYAEALETDLSTILAWGQPKGGSPEAPLSMFILGNRMSAFCNGVSELHGEVARRMWHHLWPGLNEDEVPITHVTNGVHIATWTSAENTLLFERYVGPDWHTTTRQANSSHRLDEIYDEELWHAHEISRARLIRTCRRRMAEQYGRRNAAISVMKEVETVLDQDVLRIAFARRFATYKRADLLLRDPERLEAMINHENRPVQFIFAGKAHPQDDEGKELIRRLVEFGLSAGVRHRFLFLEDFDIHLARRLVQGADVWLNTPRRPFEACGTSGIKAAVNGVLNLSVLDGWWCEGYDESRGWQIGRGEAFDDYEYQDRIEAQALYNVLENDVIPCFYERESGGLPSRWLKMMKASMKMAMQNFSAQRMVNDYNQLFYRPAAQSYHNLLADQAGEAARMSQINARLRKLWPDVVIDFPVMQAGGPLRVGDLPEINVMVNLGEIQPDEVVVELCYGPPKTVDRLEITNHQQMSVAEELSSGRYLYSCQLPCNTAGRYGFTARVTPRGDIWTRYTPGLISWA
ncbi:MAG: alpha-glucan family phosphorylase [Desulfosarcina sp.]|nr:alpha-glucan family phosphorylase [Desulfobacterales bacterium]